MRSVASGPDPLGSLRWAVVGGGGQRDSSGRGGTPSNTPATARCSPAPRAAPASAADLRGQARDRAAQRPPCRSTVTSTPKASDTAASVSTSSTGPATSRRPVAQQCGVGDPGRDLLEMVGHQDQRRHGRVGGERGQAGQEPLAGPEVESGGRLVHQDQLGIAHQRPGQQDLLALALRQQAERPLAEGGAAESGLGEQGGGPCPVVIGVLVPPRLECRVPAGQDDVEGGLGRTQRPPDRGADHGDPLAQLAHVDPAERLAQDLDDAPGRPEPGADHPEQRGLAGAVGTEQRPALARSHRPGDVVEQGHAVTDDGDPVESDDRDSVPVDVDSGTRRRAVVSGGGRVVRRGRRHGTAKLTDCGCRPSTEYSSGVPLPPRAARGGAHEPVESVSRWLPSPA